MDMLRFHEEGRARPPEVRSAIAALEKTQLMALADLPRARFIYIRMNPAAGLGNRLVAMVSGLMLAAATDRGFLVDWESYDEPRTHRSKEVSTMDPLEHFFSVPFPCDVSVLLATPESQRAFGWDYQHWRQVRFRSFKAACSRARPPEHWHANLSPCLSVLSVTV